MRAGTIWVGAGLVSALAACGGRVVVDGKSSGAAGGAGGAGASTTVVSSSTIASSSSTGGGNTCPPGTCRLLNPTDPCEAPTGPQGNSCCQCGDDGFCSELCECAAPDTPIATPAGERAIASLGVGDLVFGVAGDAVVQVPIVATHQTRVGPEHQMVRVHLANGAVLDVSRGHPTLDGRTFGQLRAGGSLGGVAIVEAELVPYTFDRTYDLLTATENGGYFAGGALIGSTLKPTGRATP